MQLETQIMERFVQIIQSDDPLINPLLNRHGVYRDMVFHRFFETLKNIYPLLTKQVGEAEFRAIVQEFIAHGANAVLLSDMPKEFGIFLQNHGTFSKRAYLQDLLWFEWSEAELLLKAYDATKSSFSWKNDYRLSDSTRLRALGYPIYKGDYSTKGVFPLLLYYNFQSHSVFFEEITPFAYELATLLQTTHLQKAIGLLGLKYGLNEYELKKVVTLLLEEWSEKMILTKDETCVL